MWLVNQHLIDIVFEVVTNRADDDVALLVKQRRGCIFICRFRNSRPQLQQVIEVPLKFFSRSADTSSTNDDTHAIGYFKLGQRVSQFGAIITLDAT